MEKISLKNFSIPSNYVLIKPDPDFEFVEVAPESQFDINGEPVKIWIGYNSETHGRHFGITGKVIAVPEKLVFNKQKIEKYKKKLGSTRMVSDQIRIANLMESSLEVDVLMELQPGDKVWFSYLCQINAVTNKILIDTEEYGMCFLARYDELYCYERDGELELINGWVWIKRIERKTTTSSGIELQLSEKNKFHNGHGEIVKFGKPVMNYMDGEKEYPWAFSGGEQVVYASKMGHPIEYGMHRKLTDSEVYSIRRKHIYAVL
jgi:co-chaperonin GroES (HSP10)